MTTKCLAIAAVLSLAAATRLTTAQAAACATRPETASPTISFAGQLRACRQLGISRKPGMTVRFLCLREAGRMGTRDCPRMRSAWWTDPWRPPNAIQPQRCPIRGLSCFSCDGAHAPTPAAAHIYRRARLSTLAGEGAFGCQRSNALFGHLISKGFHEPPTDFRSRASVMPRAPSRARGKRPSVCLTTRERNRAPRGEQGALAKLAHCSMTPPIPHKGDAAAQARRRLASESRRGRRSGLIPMARRWRIACGRDTRPSDAGRALVTPSARGVLAARFCTRPLREGTGGRTRAGPDARAHGAGCMRPSTIRAARGSPN